MPITRWDKKYYTTNQVSKSSLSYQNNKLYCDLMPITQYNIMGKKKVSIWNLLYHKTINCIVILCLLLDRIYFTRSKIGTSEVWLCNRCWICKQYHQTAMFKGHGNEIFLGRRQGVTRGRLNVHCVRLYYSNWIHFLVIFLQVPSIDSTCFLHT